MNKKFSFKKLTISATSVVIGLCAISLSNGQIKAATAANGQTTTASSGLANAYSVALPAGSKVYVPVVNNNKNLKVALYNVFGKETGESVATNTTWTAYEIFTIGDINFYRIGDGLNKLIPAQYSQLIKGNSNSTSNTTGSSNGSTSSSNMIGNEIVLDKKTQWNAYIPTINGSSQIPLFDGSGKATGKYIAANHTWKVFAKKSIGNKEYYRLGSQSQWISNDYIVTPWVIYGASGVAHVPVINHNKNYKVALIDADGHYTNKFISTNSNWKVNAKRIIDDGTMQIRIGNKDQWIPVKYTNYKFNN